MKFKGKKISLIELKDSQFEELLDVASDSRIWEYLTIDIEAKNDFKNYFLNSLKRRESGEAFPFVIILNKTDEIIGSTQLLNYNQTHGTIDSGLTWINPRYWGKNINLEVKFLILKFCFEIKNILRVQYVTDIKNKKSHKSLERAYATYEGTLRNYRNYKSGLYKSCKIYSHIKEEWQSLKEKITNKMQEQERFFSGGFLYNPKSESIFLHKRDGNTKFNPNTLAFFGGLNEGSETPKECFQRELHEEIGLKVDTKDIIYLDDYLNVEFNTYRNVFYVISDVKPEDLTLGEGSGFQWFKLDNIFEQKITEKTERDIKTFLNKIK